MNTTELLSAVDSEIARLQEARALLAGTGSRTVKAGRPAKRKYTLSPEARKRIVDAQRKRWAKQKRAAKKTA
jgi:hypothetical protein